MLFTYIQPLAIQTKDALSMLIACLVAIAFVAAWGINRIVILRIRKGVRQSQDISTIMQYTLDISTNYVLRLDLKLQHAYNLHGTLLPDEGIGYEESFKRIHPDDRDTYRAFILRLYNGEALTDECTFRWDMSGKDGLGQWRYMHDQGVAEYSGGKKTPTNIFCTLIDITEEVKREQEAQELNDKYRLTFEQSIVGLAYYDKDGHLLTVNEKMRKILNFQSKHDPYYYSHTLYEMPTFRSLLNNNVVEDLYFCTKSVVIERGVNCYTEMRVHPICDENGELVYIAFSLRDVTEERELYLQSRQNDIEMRRANEAILQYENEIQYLMDTCDMRFWRCSFADRTITFYRGLSSPDTKLSIDRVVSYLIKSVFKEDLLDPEHRLKEHKTDLALSYPIFHQGKELQWSLIDSVPYFDKDGYVAGTYGVIRNVTSLIEKQERLREETERANDSGRLKSVFMANMTHEIRTPLNSIVGFSDILPMLTTPEEKQEIVRVILNNCDMLLRLINDILAISSFDAGGIRIEPQQVNFSQSFDDICESLRERVQEPGVEFIKENPYKRFEAVIDNGRIQQVITNFVTNAVKYTHQGHIKVGYRQEQRMADGVLKDGLYIYCEDTGNGISKENQSKIFERFVKLNDFIQGTGLGLSICKAIADGCHGQIGVVSEGQDQGSTFWMWVPCEVNCEK